MIIHGDCLEKLKELPENSVDSIVTDPPYGLSFMGKKWDYDVPSKEVWQECLRVLKPGGYLLSFAGTRTQHRMAVNIEDAGFEIRDMIAWVYGSGFPKSLNIGKNGGPEGWGTALKPALEPITVARKPLGEKTVAENVLKYGTGGINIDGSRVESDEQIETGRAGRSGGSTFNASIGEEQPNHQGRFPANLIHDGSDEVVSLFPDSGNGKFSKGSVRTTKKDDNGYELGFLNGESVGNAPDNYGDSGSAARFFYCAKASKADRDEGLEGFEYQAQNNRKEGGRSLVETSGKMQKNFHPTVKPTKLMQYLVKLVTPKGGTVLDPFMGSGSTGKACKLEGFVFIGIEREEEYIKIAEARIKAVNTLL